MFQNLYSVWRLKFRDFDIIPLRHHFFPSIKEVFNFHFRLDQILLRILLLDKSRELPKTFGSSAEFVDRVLKCSPDSFFTFWFVLQDFLLFIVVFLDELNPLFAFLLLNHSLTVTLIMNLIILHALFIKIYENLLPLCVLLSA